MTITTVIQQTNVDSIGSVVATDVTSDPITGNYVRQVRVYSPPDTNGLTTLLFTLQLESTQQSSIEFTTPPSVF